MVSENKKRKQVNSYQVKTSLKDKETGMKRLTFFTSSGRKRLNKKHSFDEIFDKLAIAAFHKEDINELT